VLFGMGR